MISLTGWQRCFVACVLATLFVVSVGAQERILSFHSDLSVDVDGTMVVTEKIDVAAKGEKIRRGIYRDFPTDYRDRFGNRVQVAFEVLRAVRNGAPEPYRTVRQSNGIRVYLGSARVTIGAGEHKYEIAYRTSRMVGFFDDHDEIYWNVTGNGWEMPIEKASASLTLPSSIRTQEVSLQGFTGAVGSTAQDVETRFLSDGRPHIEATQSLAAGEGLTVAVAWPKGHVTEPRLRDDLEVLLRNNLALLIATATLISTLVCLFVAWLKVGRDPPPGVVFAHYEPPEGYSPAALRYISRMGYDPRVMAVGILSLAVKGFILIDQKIDVYTLTRTDKVKDDSVAEGEGVLLSMLFAKDKRLTLGNENHTIIGGAMAVHQRELKRFHETREFAKNSRYLAPAVAIVVGGGAAVFFRDLFTPASVAVFVVAIGLIFLFAWLLKAPTVVGRKLLDKVDGFKLYLSVAEQDELNLKNPPDRTPELFEAYLPYALALDVEQDWADQFVEVFAQSLVGKTHNHQPGWYSNSRRSFSPHRLATGLGGAFGSAITSSSSPPGSSSGFSGGSSGGGGGGGGGGGW